MAWTLLVFLWFRLGAYLDGYKVGTRAADLTPLVSLTMEVLSWNLT